LSRSQPGKRPPPLRPLTIAIEGSSGAGKTTLARALAVRTGWPVVDEAWLRVRPRPSLTFRSPRSLLRLETTLLREESRRYEFGERLRRSGRSVILDTGVLGPLTYLEGLGRTWGVEWDVRGQLPRVGKNRLGLSDVHIYLDAPPGLAARRVRRTPETHPAAWRQRHADVGRCEREFWTQTAPQLAPGHLWKLRANGSPEELTERVVRRLRSSPLPKVRPVEDRRILEYLRPPVPGADRATVKVRSPVKRR
jgi:thymidylate kinase